MPKTTGPGMHCQRSSDGAGAELHPSAGMAAARHSKKRKSSIIKTDDQPDMILALEPINLLEISLSRLAANHVHIRDATWLLSTLMAGQLPMRTAEDQELVQRTQLAGPAEAFRRTAKPPEQQSRTRQAPAGQALGSVPAQQGSAPAGMLGSLIADSQEDWHRSQDIIGGHMHTEGPNDQPHPPRSYAHQAELQTVSTLTAAAGPHATAMPGTAAVLDELEWVGDPQDPPPDCGLQATGMRRFFGAFRKVNEQLAEASTHPQSMTMHGSPGEEPMMCWVQMMALPETTTALRVRSHQNCKPLQNGPDWSQTALADPKRVHCAS